MTPAPVAPARTPRPSLPKRTGELAAEGGAWRLLSLLLERPRQGWLDEVERLARPLDDPDLRAAAAAAGEASEGLYLAVFGPGGAISPREAGHAATFEPGRLLAEVTAAYDAFAYRPVTEDPIDHLAVEAGFVAYLRLKELYALAGGGAEEAEVTAEAARAFLAEHLAPTAASVARALQETEVPYLVAAGRALARRVDGLVRERPARRIGLPVVEEESAEFECGAQPHA